MQAEDPLSRRADHEMGIDLDNTNQVLLKPEFFAINALEAIHESPINDEIILKEVKAALLSDEVTKDYKLLLKSGPREFEKSLQDWNYKNGLLLYRGKIYISHSVVTPYKRLGKISDILYLNNENNQLERRVWPLKDVPLDAQSWT